MLTAHLSMSETTSSGPIGPESRSRSKPARDALPSSSNFRGEPAAGPFAPHTGADGKVAYDLWAPGGAPHSTPVSLGYTSSPGSLSANGLSAPLTSSAGMVSGPPLGMHGHSMATTYLRDPASGSESVLQYPHGAPRALSAPAHPGHGGSPLGSPVAEDSASWQARMEAKVDRLTSELITLKHMLMTQSYNMSMPDGMRGMPIGVPPQGQHGHGVSRRPRQSAMPGSHGMPVAAMQAVGHSTSDKIDARRRRYPGFRGVPLCACCNKAFCLIFNSPGGKCKRGDQCEHAHHYMPPNAPTGSIMPPLSSPAAFK